MKSSKYSAVQHREGEWEGREGKAGEGRGEGGVPATWEPLESSKYIARTNSIALLTNTLNSKQQTVNSKQYSTCHVGANGKE